MKRLVLTLLLCHILSGLGAWAHAEAFPPDHLFVAGFQTDSVFEFDLRGTKVREFGEAGLGPGGMAFGPNGHLFVTSIKRGTIVEFAPSGSTVREVPVVADTGLRGLSWGPNGNLFVAVATANAVFELDRHSLKKLRELSSNGLVSPGGVAFGPHGHLFVTGIDSGNVVEFDTDGVKVRELSVVQGGRDLLRALTIDSHGTLFVSAFALDKVAVFTPPQTVVSRWIGEGTGLDGPGGIAVGPNDHLFVGSINTGAVLEFDPAGKVVKAITAPGLDPRFVLLAPTR